MGKASDPVNLLIYDLTRRSFFHIKFLKPHQHFVSDISTVFHQVIYNSKNESKITAWDIYQKVAKTIEQNLESHWDTLEKIVLFADDKYHTPINKNRDRNKKPAKPLTNEEEAATVAALLPVLDLKDPSQDFLGASKTWRCHFIRNDSEFVQSCMASPLVRFLLECIVSRCCLAVIRTLHSRIAAAPHGAIRVIFDGLIFCTQNQVIDTQARFQQELEEIQRLRREQQQQQDNTPDAMQPPATLTTEQIVSISFKKAAKSLYQSCKTFYVYDTDSQNVIACPQFYTMIGECDIRQMHYVAEAARQQKSILIAARDHDYALALLSNLEAWELSMGRDLTDINSSSTEIVNVTLDVLRGPGSDDEKQCININYMYDDLKKTLREKGWERFPVTSLVGLILIACKGDYLNGFIQFGIKSMWESAMKNSKGYLFGREFVDMSVDTFEPTAPTRGLTTKATLQQLYGDNRNAALLATEYMDIMNRIHFTTKNEPTDEDQNNPLHQLERQVFVMSFATIWLDFLRKFYNDYLNKAIEQAKKEKKLTNDMMELASEYDHFTKDTAGRKNRKAEEDGEYTGIFPLNVLHNVIIDARTKRSRCPSTNEIVAELLRTAWNLNYYINGWKNTAYTKNAIQSRRTTKKSLWGWTRTIPASLKSTEEQHNIYVPATPTIDCDDMTGVTVENFGLFMHLNTSDLLFSKDAQDEVGVLDTLEDHIRRVIEENQFLLTTDSTK